MSSQKFLAGRSAGLACYRSIVSGSFHIASGYAVPMVSAIWQGASKIVVLIPHHQSVLTHFNNSPMARVSSGQELNSGGVERPSLREGWLQIDVVRTTSPLRSHPVDDLVRVDDVAGLAVDAV